MNPLRPTNHKEGAIVGPGVEQERDRHFINSCKVYLCPLANSLGFSFTIYFSPLTGDRKRLILRLAKEGRTLHVRLPYQVLLDSKAPLRLVALEFNLLITAWLSQYLEAQIGDT